MKLHYTPPYLIAPQHQVTVDLVGLGGTGSIVLSNLARMNQALKALDHPGLHVRCWDNDTVTSANLGRQLFSPADLGANKAVALTTRVNQFFGTEWEAKPQLFNKKKDLSNITITCVDSAAARLKIADILGNKASERTTHPYMEPFYWLDLGNLQKTGQVVLGTIGSLKQTEKGAVGKLPTVVKLFPQLKKIKEKDQGPSCSLAEALRKQDLFINSTLAQFGTGLLWKLFREGKIQHHGCFVNLDSFIVNPIKIN